jgi:thymidylate synthase
MIEELLWFLRGSTNNNELVAKNVHIWDAWAAANGELGPIYGKQWRSWEGVGGQSIDQIAQAISLIKKTPDSRRILVSAWNVSDLPKMALMPCHALFQFYVSPQDENGRAKLSCQLYQRSADFCLGVPFNIASYSLLTHMIAQQCGLDVGDFIWTGGDCHIYSNHIEQVKLQLSRNPYPMPTLRLTEADSIDEYSLGDVVFENYQYHPSIKAPVAV